MTREHTATLNERANRMPGTQEEWAFRGNELALDEPEFTRGQVWVANATNRQLSATPQLTMSEQEVYAFSFAPPYRERTHVEDVRSYNLGGHLDDTDEAVQQALGESVRRTLDWTPMIGSHNRITTIRFTPTDADVVVITRRGASDFTFESRPETLEAEWTEKSLNLLVQGPAEAINFALTLSDLKAAIISDPANMITGVNPSYLHGQDISWNLPVMTPNGRVFRVRRIGELAPESPLGESWERPQKFTHPAVQAFSKGFGNKTPTAGALEIASRLAEAAETKAKVSEIEVDETDGMFSFEIRLANDRLVVGELSIEGDLHVNVYYDEHPDPDADLDEIWEKHMPHASAADVISLL